MKADDLVVTAKRSWGYRKWLVLRSWSQGIPFFESAPERERRGKERLGDGFGLGAYGTISSLFFFFFFFFLSLIQRRLTKQQGNIAGDGATLNSCSWSLLWQMAHRNYPYVSRSLHSFMFFIILLLFFLSFVYPPRLSLEAYEDSEANTTIMAQGHGHASRARTGNLPCHSVSFFF